MFEIDLPRHVPVLRPQPPGVGKINFFNIPSTFQNMLCCCVKLILLEGLFLSMKCWSHNFALNNYQPFTDSIGFELCRLQWLVKIMNLVKYLQHMDFLGGVLKEGYSMANVSIEFRNHEWSFINATITSSCSLWNKKWHSWQKMEALQIKLNTLFIHIKKKPVTLSEICNISFSINYLNMVLTPRSMYTFT